jgi:hypothetical protein
VPAGLIPAAAASDTGGSIRIQLRLVLEGPTLANRKSRIVRRRATTRNVRASPPVTRYGYLRIQSLVLLVTSILSSVILMR